MFELETERLIIRPWLAEDLNDFYEYAKNPDVGPHAGWRPHDNILESAGILMSWLNSDENRALVHKADGKVIGSISLFRHKRPGNLRCLGYVLAKPYWGQGLMTEAARAALRCGFEEMGLDMILVQHFPENDRSRRVIEKLGFHYEGTLRRAYEIYDGSLRDDVNYSMTREEYFRTASCPGT